MRRYAKNSWPHKWRGVRGGDPMKREKFRQWMHGAFVALGWTQKPAPEEELDLHDWAEFAASRGATPVEFDQHIQPYQPLAAPPGAGAQHEQEAHCKEDAPVSQTAR